jgi:hypothetical protein
MRQIPVLSCFDDAFLARFFFPFRSASASIASYIYLSAFGGRAPSFTRRLINVLFGLLVVKLSLPVVSNLFSKKQIMNGSFDKFRLINTYGAFGTVDEERMELIIEASDSYSGPWVEYSFKVKPGDVTRQPRWISPYHYRLDWQMWIASVAGGIDRSPWMYSFLLKLLQQDSEVLSLLDHDPWENLCQKPKYIRVDKYRYKFASRNNSNDSTTSDEDILPDQMLLVSEGNSTTVVDAVNSTILTDGEGNLTDVVKVSIESQTQKQQPYWEREKVGRYFPKQGLATEEMLQKLVHT